MRQLETLVSQERYFCFSALRDGRFYVQKCSDAGIEQRALQEIKGMLKLRRGIR